MFKLKILSLLMLFAIVALSSCDGRDKARRTAQQDLIENKVLDTFTKTIEFIPKTYTEVKRDTILNNGFKVKIKTFTDMRNSVLYHFDSKDSETKKYYRSFISNILVYKNNHLIFEKEIKKSQFANNEDFWNHAIMGSITIDELHTKKENLILNLFFCIPDSEICKDYKLTISNTGVYTTEEINYPELP